MQGFKFTTPVSVDPGCTSAPMGKSGDGSVSFAGNPMVSVVETPLFGTKDFGTSRYAGEASQQGDGNFDERHSSTEVDPAVTAIDKFEPQNFDGDTILEIATGPSDGPQQNPAADPALSDNSGLADEPMPDGGVQYPVTVPANVSLNPGVQGSGLPAGPLTRSAKSPGDMAVGNSAGVMSSIATGASRILGGAGAAVGESGDVALSEVNDFPAPPAAPKDPWIPSQPIVNVQDHVGPGPEMGVNTSPSP